MTRATRMPNAEYVKRYVREGVCNFVGSRWVFELSRDCKRLLLNISSHSFSLTDLKGVQL